jgi:hypothetical protein
MQASRPVLDRNQLGRYVAAVLAVVAFVCFYQPWVAASLPRAGQGDLTGMDLARGEAARRVDAATFGNRGGTGATPVPGAAIAGAGGLVLPTRIPTFAPGTGGLGQSASVATPVPPIAPGSAAPAAGAAGDLTLPTRVPTVAPAGAAGSGGAVPAGVAIATSAAATAQAAGTARAGGNAAAVTTADEQRDELPQMPLYGVPLAAAGLAIFAVIWDRLSEPRDRLFGKLWTIVLSAGGTLGVGYVLFKVATAPSNNNLLAPGAVTGAQWGLWAAFFAFLLSALSLAIAWTARPRPRVT